MRDNNILKCSAGNQPVVAECDSESESLEKEQPPRNQSRQKKFFKNFKQLPQEEVVLQSKCVLQFSMTPEQFAI